MSFSSETKPVVVYLGPEGTFSHQVARDRFGSSAEYKPCATISDVYNYRPSDSQTTVLHLIPLKNSTHGAVRETLELLCDEKKLRQDLAVREEFKLSVKHCLIVAKGNENKDLKEFKWVRSHEQALGQCQKFLSDNMSEARRLPTSSTALAAVSLLPNLPSDMSPEDALEQEDGLGAAISSRTVAELYDGLAVWKEGIEDKKGNTTHFLLLSSPSVTVPAKQGPDEDKPRQKMHHGLLYFSSVDKMSNFGPLQQSDPDVPGPGPRPILIEHFQTEGSDEMRLLAMFEVGLIDNPWELGVVEEGIRCLGMWEYENEELDGLIRM
ncbi:Prephenate dehydratase [Phaffia rhodozyma]|uniref:Prephenate dehydratase n=1 Tax=Phaffia rhodozyma TaxID=264483 RepID=A0A0F7SQB1_PHARH|nr:Prephenate dehydratase [Phaffia rhodozyma]